MGVTPHHQHALSTVTVLLSGAWCESYRGRQPDVWCQQQGLLVRPAGAPHVDRFGPVGARNMVVEVRDETVAELREQGVRLDAVSLWSAPELTRLGRRLAEELTAQGPGVDGVMEGLVFQVFADLGRLQLRGGRRTVTPPAWLARARNMLNDCLADSSLRVSQVARAVNVHPVHLSRVFADHQGCSPAEYLHRVRLDHALRLLPTARPLTEVALASGFSDQSHLTRCFRSSFGTTPGAWRRRPKKTN